MTSDLPAVVTIKAFSASSSGRQASIANVMTVINNPDTTTLRAVIASEIKAANPLLGFDDSKHIAAVETGEETNIKQLLDLPMSILLKQQAGIQDGVIHVAVDMPSPITKKPPPSKELTVINNKNRINPFKDSSRENFPPLDELFGSNTPPSPAQNKSSFYVPCSSSRSSSPVNSSSLSSRTSSASICHDFSLDMSIAGQAAMAHHRYQIEKYGIDGDKLNTNNNDNEENISPLSVEKDWDQLMDADESLAPTDVNNTLYVSRMSESHILSPSNQTTVSDSYFDKSVIEALKTPEKNSEGGGNIKPCHGVTLSRGIDLNYSDDENSILGGSSPDASTQVTNTSGLNGIFRAAMRLHNDFDDKASRGTDGNESSVSTNISMSRKGRKSLSVSFAMDESFAIERQTSSKKRTYRADDEDLHEFGDFLLSPIGRENKDATFHVDSSFFAHQPSPPSSCVENSCLETSSCPSTPMVDEEHAQSTSLPIAGQNTPSSSEQKNEILRSKSLDEACLRRKLQFDSPGHKEAVSEVGASGFGSARASPSSKEVGGLSSGMNRRSSSTGSLDKLCSERLSRDDTQTTTPLDESSFVSHKDTRSMPLRGNRLFGSDASSRLNAQSTQHSTDKPNTAAETAANRPKSADGKRRVSGVSKLFELGFEMIDIACSSGSRNNSF